MDPGVAMTPHLAVTLAVAACAVPTFFWLLFVSAPYGRHTRAGWGPALPPRWGWILMESPAFFGFLGVWLLGARAWEPVPLAMAAIWLVHYGYRTLVFPFRLRSTRRVPLIIALTGFGFNAANAWINARQVSEVGDYRAWVGDPRFAVGIGLFGVGWLINQAADQTLLELRNPGDTGYRIPHGGLYRYVSCPNYLGEMLEWLGWAVLTWSWPGLAFFVFTVANLLPRALHHHAWYRRTFPDYPRERKALLPWLL